MNETMTREQAVALAESGWWEGKDARSLVEFQLFQDRLCMPWTVFHGAVEEVLGRPVFTHEFAYAENLKAEFLGNNPAPTFAEIMDLIPPEKRIVLLVD